MFVQPWYRAKTSQENYTPIALEYRNEYRNNLLQNISKLNLVTRKKDYILWLKGIYPGNIELVQHRKPFDITTY